MDVVIIKETQGLVFLFITIIIHVH